MLVAHLLGPATTPGQLHCAYDAPQAGPSSLPYTPTVSSSRQSGRKGKVGRSVIPAATGDHGSDHTGTVEELVWYEQTVIWSRGAQVVRKYTYEHEGEDVACALFARFSPPDPPDSRASHQARTRRDAASVNGGLTGVDYLLSSKGKHAETFGPFHHSQTAKWGQPKAASSSASSPSPSESQRALVVFLQTRAWIYWPNGESVVVHLPFPVDGAWAIPTTAKSDAGGSAAGTGSPAGGIIVQRALDRRERQPIRSVLGGIHDVSTSSALDELDSSLDDALPLPRLYTLGRPFEELRPVVLGSVQDGAPYSRRSGCLLGHGEAASSDLAIIQVLEEYGLVVLHNKARAEIILCRWVSAPADATSRPTDVSSPEFPLRPIDGLPAASTPAAGVRTMHPAELLAEAPMPQPVPPRRPPRPSLARNPSSMTAFPSGDRRVSSAADPLDRTQRRAPRMSRGTAPPPLAAQAETENKSKQSAQVDELHAALDPPPFTALATSSTFTNPPASAFGQPSGAGSNAPRASRSRASIGPAIVAANSSEDRRLSGASALVGREVDSARIGKAPLATIQGDLRETTMMMGLERDDDVQRSEWVLDRIWTWRPPHGVALETIQVFLSDNISSDSFTLNLHTLGQLHVFAVRLHQTHRPHWTVAYTTSTYADAALPVMATRPAVFDTVILDHNGKLELLTGGMRSIPLNVPAQPVEGHDEVTHKLASSLHMMIDDPGPARSNIDHRIVGLADAAGSSFSILFDNGAALRADVDFAIPEGLARRCLEATSYLISQAAFFVLKRELSAQYKFLPVAQREAGAAWRVFSRVLSGLLGLTCTRPATALDKLTHSALRGADPITRRLAKAAAIRPVFEEDEVDLLFMETIEPKALEGIILALHLVAQDCRLMSSRQCELLDVADLLVKLASAAGLRAWADYWLRLIPSAVSSLLSEGENLFQVEGFAETPIVRPANPSLLAKYETPPDVIEYLQHRLTRQLRPFPSPSHNMPQVVSELGSPDPCKQTRLVCQVYEAIGPSTTSGDILARAASMVNTMIRLGLTHVWIHDLPGGVAMPIYEMLRVCQGSPQTTWSREMCQYVGREDLAAQRSAHPSLKTPPSEVPEGDRLNVAQIKEGRGSRRHQTATPHVRFNADRRLQEVERIMQTTKVRTLAIADPKGASEADVLNYHQNVVNTIANRTLSITVGQGIFEYGTKSTNITNVWEIPLIELSVKVLPGNNLIQAQIVSENADWPCFHNGVSAALSISPECKGIDSSWIVFNRPPSLNPEHGGFLLGLGLVGHLRKLQTYHAFPYMEPRHDFTSVGLLLGLSCSFAGSEDLLLTKILSLHTHALLPLGSMELNASPLIQCSALLGLGLVYVGSRNLRMAEVTLAEVGRKDMPGVDNFVDHAEAYSFSAAMAFGLIMLGRGGSAASEADRRMLVQLRRRIHGDAPSLERSRTSAHASDIDVKLTSAASTLALGLMYLKTNRRDVADILSIPQTAFDLESVQPELLLLRTFARGLIMWNEIAPSKAWIEAQLPGFIQAQHKNHRRSAQMELATELAYLHIISGACLAIGLKYAGTAAELAHTNLMSFFSVLAKAATGPSMTYEGRIKRQAARQGLNVVTIALAVVMSGTGELNVLRRLRVAHGQEGAGVTYGTHMAMHMACGILFLGRGHFTLGSSNLAIAAMAIAFFPRFQTSAGDNKAYPQAFRHLWALAVEPRCLIAKDVDSGETVYLLVKVKLKDGDTLRQQSLISPTLIAPFESLLSIEVDSPRYWPITYDLSSGSKDRETLVRTRTIYVKRKTGFLDYQSDPKGNRSIFVRAGSMTGIDMHWDLLSAAAPPSPSASDVLELMRAHSADTALVGLARRFADAPTVVADPASAFASASTGIAASPVSALGRGLDEAIRTVLVECVALDKQMLLPLYFDLLTYLGGRDDLRVQRLKQLDMLLHFASASVFEKHFVGIAGPSTERRAPWIRIALIADLHRMLLRQAEASRKTLDRYLLEGQWPSSTALASSTAQSHEEQGLAVYLSNRRVPPVELLGLLKQRVAAGSAQGVDPGVLQVRAQEAAETFASVVSASWEQTGPGGNGGWTREAGWKAESVAEAVRLWAQR